MSTSAATSDVPAGGLPASIRAALPSLHPSEQRVAQVCLDQPGDVVEWSSAELAAAAGTRTRPWSGPASTWACAAFITCGWRWPGR